MNNNIYNISHENSKTNYEKMIILINDFLNLRPLKIKDISTLYVNRGPGSFAGIRNSLAIVKAMHLAHKIDYYCYSFNILVMRKTLNVKIFLIYAINLK